MKKMSMSLRRELWKDWRGCMQMMMMMSLMRLTKLINKRFCHQSVTLNCGWSNVRYDFFLVISSLGSLIDSLLYR